MTAACSHVSVRSTWRTDRKTGDRIEVARKCYLCGAAIPLPPTKSNATKKGS